MTINIQVTETLTKITGLTDGKTYTLQGKSLLNGKMKVIEIELLESDTTPSDSLVGQSAKNFKFQKKEGIDIYVRAYKNMTLIIMECD